MQRTFYTLALTQAFSMIGSQMSMFALGIWIFTDTGDTTPLLMVAFFSTLPTILAGSLAGVLADRWNRRRVIMLADAAQAIPTLLLMISFMTNSFSLWQLYLAAVIQATFGALQNPAITASITMLVPDSDRERANSIMQILYPAAGLIAPMVAGALYAFVKVEGILMIDLITFLVAVAVISQVHIPQPEVSQAGHTARGSIFKEMRGSFQFLRERPTLLGMMVYVAFINFLVAGPMTLTTPYVLTLTDNEKLVGLIQTLMNLGPIVGAIGLSAWGGTRPRIHTIMGGVVMLGFFQIMYGLARAPITLSLALFFLLLPTPAINALFMSIMQTKTPPDMQGRIFALLNQMAMMVMPLSFLITGPLVDKVLEPSVGKAGWDRVAPLVGSEAGAGMGLLMVGAGLTLVVSSLLVYANPKIRHMEAELPDYAPESKPEETAAPMLPELEAASA